MNLDDILSLADAADELGLAPATLRAQAAAGRLRAKVVGKTWITTRQEVERYRRENLGQVGRPVAAHARHAAAAAAAHAPTILAVDGRTSTRQRKIKPTREPGT